MRNMEKLAEYGERTINGLIIRLMTEIKINAEVLNLPKQFHNEEERNNIKDKIVKELRQYVGIHRDNLIEFGLMEKIEEYDKKISELTNGLFPLYFDTLKGKKEANSFSHMLEIYGGFK